MCTVYSGFSVTCWNFCRNSGKVHGKSQQNKDTHRPLLVLNPSFRAPNETRLQSNNVTITKVDNWKLLIHHFANTNLANHQMVIFNGRCLHVCFKFSNEYCHVVDAQHFVSSPLDLWECSGAGKYLLSKFLTNWIFCGTYMGFMLMDMIDVDLLMYQPFWNRNH